MPANPIAPGRSLESTHHRSPEPDVPRSDGRTPPTRSVCETLDGVLDRIGRSSFRAKFHLTAADVTYARERGPREIESHAARFVAERLAAATPDNDGRQTPMRGHPVFRAQHATATCCRGCLAKHHGIVKHHPLTDEHQTYVVAVIMRWIERELVRHPVDPGGAAQPATRRAPEHTPRPQAVLF